MAGWHPWLDGRESEWTPGVGDGQGGLACCDSWGCKESDMTERLIWTDTLAAWSRKTFLGFALYINENLNPHRNYKWFFAVGLLKKKKQKLGKQPRISFNGWMEKPTMVHPHNGIHFSNKRHKLLKHSMLDQSQMHY